MTEVCSETAEGSGSKRREGDRGCNLIIEDVLHQSIAIWIGRAVVIATHKPHKPIKTSLINNRY